MKVRVNLNSPNGTSSCSFHTFPLVQKDGAVLAETMEQKTFIFTVRQRFMEWFVSPNFWLNSRNYFQFSIVSVDGHAAYLQV